mmetsp:Transcript_2397/g.5139  ORF Transcript_2397/g.5139 Transcript_2397/m.5139 type:complete len:177 (+) Transcript_2397:198-728(+)
MEQIRKEENDQYSQVLLQIIEDAKERADGLGDCIFDDGVPTSYGSIDPLIKHARNHQSKGNRESLKKLIDSLQNEVSAERDRELLLLRVGNNEHERKRIEFEVMKERSNAADRLMLLLGPGSKFIDYLSKSVKRSEGMNWGQVSPPLFGCEVVLNPLSRIPLSVRKCYEPNVRRRR